MAGAPLGVADPVTLIRGARVFDRDLDVHKPPARDVIIEGNRVASVTPSGEIGDRKIRIAEAAQRKSSNARLIDAEGKMLIPGLINSHYHSYDVLSKGRFEDMPLRRLVPAFPARVLGQAQQGGTAGADAVRGDGMPPPWHHHHPGYEYGRPAG
jgi:cytosine/adenosine deaminase-related metal-dependent hydrolase